MTRWLQAAQRASGAGKKLNLPKQPPAPEVNSVNSVNSGGQKANAAPPEMTPEELARDLYEERAAIREYDGGQDRAEAEAAAWQEAMRAAGITALDEWRQGSGGNSHRQRAPKMEGHSDGR